MIHYPPATLLTQIHMQTCSFQLLVVHNMQHILIWMCLLLLLDQSREKSKKDPGDSFRVLVHRAASAASKLAKHAYDSASANKRMDDELVPLKCCLMSVSLPWDYIAHDLLHKVSFLH
jgi:hypothetical protein